MQSDARYVEPTIFRDLASDLRVRIRGELDRRGWEVPDLRGLGYGKRRRQDISAWLRQTPEAHRFGYIGAAILAERLGIRLRIVPVEAPPSPSRRRAIVGYEQAVAA